MVVTVHQAGVDVALNDRLDQWLKAERQGFPERPMEHARAPQDRETGEFHVPTLVASSTMVVSVNLDPPVPPERVMDHHIDLSEP